MLQWKIGKENWISINCNYDEVRSIIKIILKVLYLLFVWRIIWTDDHVSFIYKCVHSVHSVLNDER